MVRVKTIKGITLFLCSCDLIGMVMVNRKHTLKESGQTVVEYILLMTVVFTLIFTFVNSEFYQTMFGENGRLAQGLKSQTEFGYRHAFMRGRPSGVMPMTYNGASSHPSYSVGSGQSRFFGPKDPYQ